MIDWHTILWCCITLGFLLICFLLIYYIVSARMMKKKREELKDQLNRMKPGKDILFAGGIRGKIIRAKEEYLDVEVAKGIEITISRLAVNQVLEKKLFENKIMKSTQNHAGIVCFFYESNAKISEVFPI